MVAYFVPNGQLGAVLEAGRGQRMFSLSEADGGTWFASFPSKPFSEDALRQPRAVQSPKGFFMPATESVGRYGGQAAAGTAVQTGAVVLVGVRACELRAQAYLDKVLMQGDFDDPAYAARREAATIVACDCVDCAESCCCTLVGGRPFAAEGFDANLSPIDGGFVVEIATDKGGKLFEASDMPEATTDQLARRDETRKRMEQRVAQQNARFTFPAEDKAASPLPEGEDDGWQAFAADCVECGACTHICPTCHCFYLYDQILGAEAFERVKTWDSCLLSSYHRMAGGERTKLTPRPRLSSRLANRVLHKFTYSPQQYELLGCVGCGRCIDACLGDIDIREVVQTLGSGQGERSP
jgi:ferredoxin